MVLHACPDIIFVYQGMYEMDFHTLDMYRCERSWINA